MTLLFDFASSTVGRLPKNDDHLSRYSDVAVALEHFKYSPHHLARTGHQFSQLLPYHPNLHPIRMVHGLLQCGELNERSVNTRVRFHRESLAMHEERFGIRITLTH